MFYVEKAKSEHIVVKAVIILKRRDKRDKFLLATTSKKF